MKRCPTCNQTFDEDWLSFCTQDGTTLIEESGSLSGPPPTMMSPPMPPSMSPNEQTTVNLPGSSYNPLPNPYAAPPPPAPYAPPPPPAPFAPPGQSPWQPPPPPPYAAGLKQGMAIASLCCGVFSLILGWCCYTGVITGPLAIVFGIIALNNIKKSPELFTGRPMAIAGIVTGSLYFVFLALIILIYGIAFLAQGVR
jgi:hypothetical protein